MLKIKGEPSPDSIKSLRASVEPLFPVVGSFMVPSIVCIK